ncbi:hypothetical protein KFK09_012810 [Dendrobium nobile]|uniref:Uncharacterized protein n=1 Tax=Dendrobium nobile TaxID=94219 RepID=A0A8T3BGI6_DENNO|nr:hypothetical protein KFK09_012810 [Dendrobium nobile]
MPVELIEGDTIRLGASTRIYCLHWMPLSHTFEMEKPMSLGVSIFDTTRKPDPENPGWTRPDFKTGRIRVLEIDPFEKQVGFGLTRRDAGSTQKLVYI